ncbi:MAG TPA: formate dehydrogenase subunit alpha, partial [Cellulomonas sp.]|nr:formate dehydrogenase subunit alpha [Cellulomonas sp.]
ALTLDGRGFDTKITAGAGESFLDSECVSCGACVQACPTATLQERSVVDLGMPNRTVLTTCAYCGVGCSFKAELRGDEIVRMVPHKDGGANEGHSCVKGRFAFGYASHPDRVLAPMVRDSITDDWREVSWDEALDFAAVRLRAIQAAHGPGSIGAITSSRCTNEEVYVVQKMVRAAFGNNNVDTCARVCHSPTGYGLKQTFGTSAGTQDFRSVAEADVILLIGANPTDGHPVFASRMKRRLREGAQLVVIDPRRIDLVRSPHVRAAHHLALRPGTNVAIVNAFAHVVVTEGLGDAAFVAERCEGYDEWAAFIARPEHSPEAVEEITGVPAADVRAAARLYAGARNAAIYYGLGVTEHSQGSTMVMGMANLAMATGNIGRDGVGVNPLRGQNNVQGSCDMGSFPHELPGYRHVSDDAVRAVFESVWGTELRPEPGLRIPNMFDAAVDGTFRALFVHGEDIAQSDPNTAHVEAALAAMDLVVVQDLFVNETARFAHVLLPGTSFLEKDGTFTNAERRINRVRPVMAPRTGKHEWQIVCELATRMGYP